MHERMKHRIHRGQGPWACRLGAYMIIAALAHTQSYSHLCVVRPAVPPT